jgi:hypothetical protein
MLTARYQTYGKHRESLGIIHVATVYPLFSLAAG